MKDKHPTAKLYLESPLGKIRIEGNEDGVTVVSFCEEEAAVVQQDVPEALNECRRQLQAYFDGTLKHFSVRLQPEGTAFQQAVWEELRTLPYGNRCSYKELALRRWNDKTIRAVGTANGQNPIAIIIPCHRVIGSNGDLTGYAGGLWRKKWLLEHEQGHTYGHQASLF